jgi:drug/metabolite transporter (DMT)-like permease
MAEAAAQPCDETACPKLVLPLPVVTERPLRGVLLMVAGLMSFSGSDCCAKLLSGTLPSIEIGWLRYAGFITVATLGVAVSGRWPVARRPGLALARGVAMFGSAIFFIVALGHMPIADATATGFSSPLIVTLLAIFVLGEKIPAWRWVTLALGVVGMVLIVRPGTSSFNAASVFVLAGAFSWATGAVITRKMGHGEAPLTLLFITAAAGFAISSALVPFVWTPIALWQWGIGAAMGIFNAVAHWLVIRAHRHAGASVLAPFAYTQLLWSILFGLLLFGTVPALSTLLGAGLIIATAVYGYQRQRQMRGSTEAA